jgi:hypothetical protein
MLSNSFRTLHRIECCMLDQPRPAGPLVGYYAGQPIAAAVVDYFGRRFIYAGIAPRLRNGCFDVGSLRAGEWIVEPGLVYYRDPKEPDDALRKQRASGDTSMPGSA